MLDAVAELGGDDAQRKTSTLQGVSRVCHERKYHRVVGHDGVRLPYEETVEFLTRSRKPVCRYARADNLREGVFKRKADGLPNDVRRRDRQPQRFQGEIRTGDHAGRRIRQGVVEVE